MESATRPYTPKGIARLAKLVRHPCRGAVLAPRRLPEGSESANGGPRTVPTNVPASTRFRPRKCSHRRPDSSWADPRLGTARTRRCGRSLARGPGARAACAASDARPSAWGDTTVDRKPAALGYSAVRSARSTTSLDNPVHSIGPAKIRRHCAKEALRHLSNVAENRIDTKNALL